MNILHLTPTYLPTMGGAEIFIDLLVQEQGKAEGDQSAVAYMSRHPVDHQGRHRVYPVHQPRLGPLDTGRAIKSLRSVCREFNADVLHCHYGYPTGAIARRLDLPWVITSHGGDLYPHSHHRQKARHWREIGLAYREAEAVISISHFTTRVLREELGVSPERMELIPNGIDPEPFQKELPRPQGFENRPYVFFIGRLARVKNAGLLLEAFAHPAMKDSELTLVIAGDGDQREPLEQQVQELGLANRVHFAGRVSGDPKVAWLQHAAAVLMPSHEEACPIVAIEAITCGRPLLTSDIDAFDLFHESGSTHQRLPHEADAWAKAIAALPDAPDGNVESAILEQAEEYSIATCARRHRALYKKIIG
ncbi:MAG: glycosyltransferase family 4 protein [Gammaproteobacteria bacterium]